MSEFRPTPEEVERGKIVDRLQVAMARRAAVRDQVRDGSFASYRAAADALAMARAEVDRTERELFEYDVAHPRRH